MAPVTSSSQVPKGAAGWGGGTDTAGGWVEAGQNRTLASEGEAGTQLESCSLFLKIKHSTLLFWIFPWNEASQLLASF